MILYGFDPANNNDGEAANQIGESKEIIAKKNTNSE